MKERQLPGGKIRPAARLCPAYSAGSGWWVGGVVMGTMGTPAASQAAQHHGVDPIEHAEVPT